MARIAVLTSGGDAPGMNAAIRAAVMIGLAHGYDVLGVERGYRGLLDDRMRVLGPADVATILRDGGTMLGSVRCKEFHRREARDRARTALRNRGVEGLIVIGGNGSLTGALALGDPEETDGEPVRVIGVPASIDNDIALTSMSIGVDTAMNTIVEACDNIADTATAHDRTFIVEVMGRDCGYLAMTAGVAVGADSVLFPEAGSSADDIVQGLVDTVRAVRSRTQRTRRVICIKAEGVPISAHELKQRVSERLRSDPAEPVGAGNGDERDRDIAEIRVTVLGHVVRGGRPSAFDRLLGSRLANVAVRALIAGQTSKMAAWMPPMPLPESLGMRSSHDPYCWLVDLPAVIEESKKLLTGESPLSRWRANVFADLDRVFLL